MRKPKTTRRERAVSDLGVQIATTYADLERTQLFSRKDGEIAGQLLESMHATQRALCSVVHTIEHPRASKAAKAKSSESLEERLSQVERNRIPKGREKAVEELDYKLHEAHRAINGARTYKHKDGGTVEHLLAALDAAHLALESMIFEIEHPKPRRPSMADTILERVDVDSVLAAAGFIRDPSP